MRSSVAYIVIAHRNPAQVARLVRRLATERATFLVHVDRRAGRVEDEIRRLVEGVPRVHFAAHRHRCYWGGFGMVNGALDGFGALVREGVPFDHALVLSGQDYPLKGAVEIERFLGQNAGRSFMTFAALPNEWPDGGLPRIERWHLVSPLVLHLRLPWRRRFPEGLVPYGGGAWVCLARSAVEYVLDFLRRRPDVVRFFAHALHPDELLFQTTVMNSELAETVTNDHLRYIDWSADPGPATLRAADFPKIVASRNLFARKFDLSLDSTILDLLDHHAEVKAVAAER
jgi:hypothetical protein